MTPEHERLASDPAWLRLIHYEPDRSSPTGWRSAIHSEGFFLAGENGATDPRAELVATIAAMERASGTEPDTHAGCRFPARRRWLADRLDPQHTFPVSACPKYDQWTRSARVESVSIVFATGYLGNPASYFGHTLLKFNFGGDEGRTPLQDVSVNYGAILTGTDDPVTYMLKGAFGGYDGGFSNIQYYFHNHNYGEIELRDLWEYRLKLAPEAVDLIVAHAWEVLGQRYDYYFFRRNCAFRMAEIVQIVDALDFIPKDRPWTIPQALLQRLASPDARGRPAIDEVIHHPSRQSRFYDSFRSLSSEEAGLLRDLVSGSERLDGHRFINLPLDSQHAVLDSLIDYYQFVATPEEKANGKITPGYASALATRYRLAPGVRPVVSQGGEAPHMGRPPSWLQLGWLRSDKFGDAISLRIRPAYYDALDTGSGHVPNSQLSMGDLQLRVTKAGVTIHRFDLVAIESVNPGLSGLPGDRGEAWKLRLGAEPLHLDCKNCLVARLQGDVGMGRRFARDIFGAFYVGGAVQESRRGQGPGFVRASGDLIVKPWSTVGMRLGYEHRLPSNVRRSSYPVAHAEIRLSLGSRGDIRLRHERDKAALTTIGIGTYW